MNDELFNVIQFFEDDTYEYVRRASPPEEAVTAAKHYVTSLGARIGTTKRVIITDMMDCTCFEWCFGVGITFPDMENKHP